MALTKYFRPHNVLKAGGLDDAAAGTGFSLYGIKRGGREGGCFMSTAKVAQEVSFPGEGMVAAQDNAGESVALADVVGSHGGCSNWCRQGRGSSGDT
jgi:hypothetical protein